MGVGRPVRRAAALGPALVAAGVLAWLGGCTRTTPRSEAPPLIVASAGSAEASAAVAAPARSAPPTSGRSGPGATPSGFGEAVAVACAGRPPGREVIALLRRSSVLPPVGSATVSSGPLCAGSWQYTVVTVPGHEPLHVITQGAPGALTLVTAGTNVCTVQVRAAAPAGILAATRCDSG